MSSSIPTRISRSLDAPVEPVQGAGAELPHHLGRKVTASLSAFRPRSRQRVAPDQHEVIAGQPLCIEALAWPGQPEKTAALARMLPAGEGG